MSGNKMETDKRMVDEVQSENGFSWVYLQNPISDDVYALSSRFSFHKLNIEDCLSKIQLPKIDKYGDHMFIILHFPPLTKDKVMPKFSQLSIFVGRDFLVTIHDGDLPPIREVFEACKEDSTKRKAWMGKSSGYLLHKIIDVMVDDLLHTLRRIVGNLDDIEDDVFDEQKSAARQISILRREITALRRIVIPSRRIIVETAKDIKQFSTEDLTLYFDDVIDHIDKVLETLEESRETMEIYKDTDFMLNSEKSNKILAVLTIFFTLAIPSTVIGSFYGMNVNLPGGVETGPWMFFGTYTTLIIIVLISVVPAVIMFFYFKKLGWLGD